MHILVVGASLAGLRTVETLRDRGFDGRLTLVGDEPHRPYDRPPLSKQVLQGVWEPERTMFRRSDGYDGLAVDLRLGTRALSLDPRERRVTLSDGTSLAYDRLVIATGTRPRTLPRSTPREGLHVLRTLDDARALADDLGRARRVAIVGGGFIGLEVAASCRARGLAVTVVEALPDPLSTVCGVTLGGLVAAIHRDHGVDLRTGVAVAGIEGDARITGLALSDGSRVEADVVVVGIGVVPNVEWLDGSGLTLDNGIVCDAQGRAGPDVYAAGDVARLPNAWLGGAVRIEHWTNAVEQGGHVAESLLAGRGAARSFSSVPYVWSDQYDRKFQFLGRAAPGDEMTIVDGSVEARQLTALFRRGERVSACLTINQPRAIVKYRKLLAQNIAWPDVLRDLRGDNAPP
jgi:NADPH-dependent 2,4-dienoyl-CoA reductase/sulfur reductase-like enzyme